MKLTLAEALTQLRDIAINLEGFGFYIDTLNNQDLSENVRSARSLLTMTMKEWSSVIDCALTRKTSTKNHQSYRKNLLQAITLLEDIYIHDKNSYLNDIISSLQCIFTVANTTRIVVDKDDQKRLIEITTSLKIPKDW